MKQKRLVPKRRFKGFTDDWKSKVLDDLGSFGKTHPYSRAMEGSGKYHHIHYGDIHVKLDGIINKNTVIPSLKVEGNHEILKDNDIVIADASEDYVDLGKTVIVENTNNRKIIAGLHTFKFTPNSNLNSKFYLYYSQSNLFKKFSYRNGTGISVFGMSKENMGKMQFNIPSIEEQQKIGQFFKHLDEMISFQERKVEKTKALKDAYLAEMFPAEGERVPKRRFEGFTEEWKSFKLKEIIVSETKGNARADMIGNKSIYLETEYLNGGDVSTVNSPTNVDKDDVLILWDGSHAGKVYHDFYGALGSTLKTLRPIESGKFIYYYLSANQREIFKNYRTPNIPHVINTFTDEFTIKKPCLEEQKRVGEFFKQLDDIITNQQQRLDKLKATKQAYLHEMFV